MKTSSSLSCLPVRSLRSVRALPWTKYTAKQLRKFANKHTIVIAGEKMTSSARAAIRTAAEMLAAVIYVQRVFRGILVRRWTRARNYQQSSPPNIVDQNTSDFFSLAPIAELPQCLVFRFVDGAGYQYAFQVASLARLICSSGGNSSPPVVVNPYNREPIHAGALATMMQFCRLTWIIVGASAGGIDDDDDKQVFARFMNAQKNSINDVAAAAIAAAAATTTTTEDALVARRRMSIQQRIVDLFCEIDLLGNYAQLQWFTSLSVFETIQFWGILFDIWVYRAGILEETKQNVCPLHDPFAGKHMIRDLFHANHAMPYTTPITELPHIDVVRDYCLFAMENMVFMGHTTEFRQLGAQYVLMAMTVISFRARIAMPWLFENILY